MNFMNALVNNLYKLERFTGKGGWTFVRDQRLNRIKINLLDG
jgi:hypothetical protein